jgi:hypothetical protein
LLTHVHTVTYHRIDTARPKTCIKPLRKQAK